MIHSILQHNIGNAVEVIKMEPSVSVCVCQFANILTAEPIDVKSRNMRLSSYRFSTREVQQHFSVF